MSERKPPSSLDDFGVRLEQAQARNDPRRQSKGSQGGYGAAFQVAIEMVGSLVVSVGLGWLLDDWLGTGPVFLVIFFFLGAAAGGLNVYRRALLMVAPTDEEHGVDDDTPT
jgi:ATP synthase protein I